VNRTLIRVTMGTAAIMVGHQVAAKALRDTTFLTSWPATALPLMMVGTAAFTGLLVPIFSRLIGRFSAVRVVALGFALSAAANVLEWVWYDASRWTAVIIYLHLTGAGAVLLSGFWSLIAERFDPAGARAEYGRIGAAGTAGGIAGSIAAERIASMLSPAAVLLLLATAHVLCVFGLSVLQRAPTLLSQPPQPDRGQAGLRVKLRSPYLRTIATFVVLTSAASSILDFLFKAHVRASLGTGADLMRFFSLFYGSVQLLSFIAQTRSTSALRRLGIDGAIATQPAGVGVLGTLALLVPVWPVLVVLRAVDAALHNSFFRSGYELLFVPMDPDIRRRFKTTLDVICDRIGEAAGSALVQLTVMVGVVSVRPTLLTITVTIAVVAFWVGRRLGPLYVGLVEHELVKYQAPPQLSLVSEAGWTLVDPPEDPRRPSTVESVLTVSPAAAPPRLDPVSAMLADLRSRDVTQVTAALERVSEFERIHVAQTIDLLAWDAVLPAARLALEQLAPNHLGTLIDAMVNPNTDFIVRRRLPRILGTVPVQRSLDGLLIGLDDLRFEVRYYSSRAITRILKKNPGLSVDPARVIAVVERELLVPPQRWRGYKLLDRPEIETDVPTDRADVQGDGSTYVQYLTLLLSTIIAPQPLDAAVQGIRSTNPGVRGLAREYLDHVLPSAVLDRLTALIGATSSAADAPGPSGVPPQAGPSSAGR
jgi:AAA family ATP:ADP antiporter